MPRYLTHDEYYDARRIFEETGHDYYQVLGVDRNATLDQMKSAYKKLAIKYHPDKLSDLPPDEQLAATQRFQHIATAYGILSDEENRIAYNISVDVLKIANIPEYDYNDVILQDYAKKHPAQAPQQPAPQQQTQSAPQQRIEKVIISPGLATYLFRTAGVPKVFGANDMMSAVINRLSSVGAIGVVDIQYNSNNRTHEVNLPSEEAAKLRAFIKEQTNYIYNMVSTLIRDNMGSAAIQILSSPSFQISGSAVPFLANLEIGGIKIFNLSPYASNIKSATLNIDVLDKFDSLTVANNALGELFKKAMAQANVAQSAPQQAVPQQQTQPTPPPRPQQTTSQQQNSSQTPPSPRQSTWQKSVPQQGKARPQQAPLSSTARSAAAMPKASSPNVAPKPNQPSSITLGQILSESSPEKQRKLLLEMLQNSARSVNSTKGKMDIFSVDDAMARVHTEAMNIKKNLPTLMNPAILSQLDKVISLTQANFDRVEAGKKDNAVRWPSQVEYLAQFNSIMTQLNSLINELQKPPAPVNQAKEADKVLLYRAKGGELAVKFSTLEMRESVADLLSAQGVKFTVNNNMIYLQDVNFQQGTGMDYKSGTTDAGLMVNFPNAKTAKLFTDLIFGNKNGYANHDGRHVIINDPYAGTPKGGLFDTPGKSANLQIPVSEALRQLADEAKAAPPTMRR